MARTTKADRFLIVFLIAASIAALIGLPLWVSQKTVREVSIQVNGKEQQRIALDGSTDGKIYKISSTYGENLIAIEDQKVHIVEANCPDHLCINQGWISAPGEMLVCLPNRLFVEIVGGSEDEASLDAVIK